MIVFLPKARPKHPERGRAEARDGCYPGGERNKASSQNHGEPELHRPMEPVTERRGTEDQWEKLDRDQSRGMQLKVDLQYKEQTLKRQRVEVRERTDDGAGRDKKIQYGVHSMQ